MFRGVEISDKNELFNVKVEESDMSRLKSMLKKGCFTIFWHMMTAMFLFCKDIHK